MTTQQTCPHCGAETIKQTKDARWHECGTVIWLADILRVDSEVHATTGEACYQRQLAAQAAEIERLKQAVLDENKHCSDIADQLGTFGYDGHKIAKSIRARGEVK